MKKQLLSLIIVAFTVTSFSQVTNEGEPTSWSLAEIKSDEPVKSIKLPVLDYDKIQKQEITKNKESVYLKPYRFGYKHVVNYGLNDSGSWTELSNGDRIWRIVFESNGAKSLNFIFDEFYMPKGGNIYIYSDDRMDLLGAYTDIQNHKDGLSTWIVKGEKVWIEYFEPREFRGQGKLHISHITHGYKYASSSKTLGESGDCNYDVDCSVGNDFDPIKDIVKKSVALLLVNGQDWCTGTLLNNVKEDKKPYILTGNHCMFDDDGLQFVNPTFVSARFNWISPNPICAATTSSTNGPTNFSISGATLRANNSDSDFVLLEMNNDIPDSWDVTFAGWDKSDDTPSFVVGIHHPEGDIMKVCRDNTGVIKAPHSIDQGPTAQTWEITTAGNGWELGVTERGSSGSAIFDPDGRVIGNLFGGAAFCEFDPNTGGNTNDNDRLDFYGRFAVSWDGPESSTSSRLRDWLDPSNELSTDTLNELKNVLSTNDEVLEASLSLFPNPTRGVVQIKFSNAIGELKYDVFNVLGQVLKSNRLENDTIDLSLLPNDIYMVKITDLDRNASITKKIVLSK